MSPPQVNRESFGGDCGPGRYITDGATQTQPQYVNDAAAIEEVEREEFLEYTLYKRRYQ